MQELNTRKSSRKELRKLIVILFTILIVTTTTITTTVGSSFPYIRQAYALDCELTFSVLFEKIHIFDDHDHGINIGGDPGEWSLWLAVAQDVHPPPIDSNIVMAEDYKVWGGMDVYDEDENGDDNGGIYALNLFPRSITIPYGETFNVVSAGHDFDEGELNSFTDIGQIERTYSLSNQYGIGPVTGSHQEASGEAEDGVVGDYHLFYTISLTDTSEGCLDDDFDGIQDNIDDQPNVFSDEFDDSGIGGTTNGVLHTRGDQIMIVKEGLENPPVPCATLEGLPEPDGKCVNIGSIDGGANRAEAFLCDGESFLAFIPGDAGDVRCGSIAIAATDGAPFAHLVADDDSSAELEIPAGNAIFFDETTSIITAHEDNSDTLIAETNDGRELQIAPGSSESITPDTTPPDTTIESAVDGNGDDMLELGETFSKSIEFTFTGEDNVDNPSQLKFECKVDGIDFAECESPHEYTDLDFGERTVEVRAIDRASNIDPSPASFTWIVYLEADVDIQPLDDAVSTINPKVKGTTTVAILGNEEFGDVSEVDTSSIKFEGASPSSTKPRIEDVNGDGVADLALKFSTQNIKLQSGDTEGCIVGELEDGTPFKGCDEVKVL